MKFSKINLFFIIINFNLQILIYGQNFELRINLRKTDEYCLSEYFPDKTFVIYKISSSSKKTKIQLKFEDELRVVKTNKEILLPITTEEGGNYEFCITNLDKNTSVVDFSLKYGVGARDYSSLARTKDLKPIDLALEKLNDRAKGLSRRISFSQSNEKIFERILDKMSSKVMFFSIGVICIMIIVGYIEILYLKNFMRKRKIV